jgi:hypothetical protein
MFPLHWLLAAFCAAQSGAPVKPAAPAVARDAELDRQNLMQLLAVRRVYVDRMDGGETASQLRDMIISGLQRSKLFAITENQERADAVLRGSGEDLVFTDTLSSSDGINAHSNFGISNGSSTDTKDSTNSSSNSTYLRDQRGVSGGMGVGEQESVHLAERKHEATASVRLVTKDGDVIWSTTQESRGAKFRGASADVADKIAKQLVSDCERARRLQDKRPE